MSDTTPEAEVEFELGLFIGVTVPASVVPAEWLDLGVPKRLYNWPDELRAALRSALSEALTHGLPEYSQATMISDAHDLPPSTD